MSSMAHFTEQNHSDITAGTCYIGLIISNQLYDKGPFLYYVRVKGWVGGPENGNFPLLYVVKMSLRRWVGGSKTLQNTLT